MKVALFIEPESYIRKSLIYWKNQFKKKYKNATYINHPLHLTFFTLEVKSNLLKDIHSGKFDLNFNSNKKFAINILEPNCFYDDPITRKNTLHYKVEKNKNLELFQIKMLKKFDNYRIYKNKNYNFGNIKLNNNFKKFGYPFLGKNWLPHFTICSIEKKYLQDNLTKKFFKSKISYNNFIYKFSLWHIDKENHIKIKDYCI